MTTSFSDVADKDQLFFTQANGEDETEEPTLQWKKQSRKEATEWVANEELSSMEPNIMEFTKVDGNTTLYSLQGIKTNVRIHVEQDVDLVLKNLILKTLGQPHDEMLQTTDRRYNHINVDVDGINLKDGLQGEF